MPIAAYIPSVSSHSWDKFVCFFSALTCYIIHMLKTDISIHMNQILGDGSKLPGP